MNNNYYYLLRIDEQFSNLSQKSLCCSITISFHLHTKWNIVIAKKRKLWFPMRNTSWFVLQIIHYYGTRKLEVTRLDIFLFGV